MTKSVLISTDAFFPQEKFTSFLLCRGERRESNAGFVIVGVEPPTTPEAPAVVHDCADAAAARDWPLLLQRCHDLAAAALQHAQPMQDEVDSLFHEGAGNADETDNAMLLLMRQNICSAPHQPVAGQHHQMTLDQHQSTDLDEASASCCSSTFPLGGIQKQQPTVQSICRSASAMAVLSRPPMASAPPAADEPLTTKTAAVQRTMSCCAVIGSDDVSSPFYLREVVAAALSLRGSPASSSRGRALAVPWSNSSSKPDHWQVMATLALATRTNMSRSLKSSSSGRSAVIGGAAAAAAAAEWVEQHCISSTQMLESNYMESDLMSDSTC